jgi:TatD DNase family protein
VQGITLRGVFHAFSGSYETYRRILRHGDFKIGIGGVSTYKNAGLAVTLEKISLDDIVLETDSPWLTPVPFRGKRNESSYLVHIAAKIAMIQSVTLETVATITTNNARKLFSL